MSGQFYWINRVNMVEVEGPFETAEIAKSRAIEAMNQMQKGFALDIAIVRVVGAGRIDSGEWVETEAGQCGAGGFQGPETKKPGAP